jgi:hypothetical protein
MAATEGENERHWIPHLTRSNFNVTLVMPVALTLQVGARTE